MSEEKKESLINIKETLFQNFINLVKEKRKVDITNEILSGDLIFANSEKAIQLGLIDGPSTYEEIGIDYNEDTVDFLEYVSAYKRKKNKSKNTIAIINLEGEIDTRESKESIINYDNVVEKLDELEDIKNLISHFLLILFFPLVFLIKGGHQLTHQPHLSQLEG